MAFGTPTYTTTSPSTALGMNEIVGALRELYVGQTVQVMSYTQNPFLAMLRKNTEFGGKYLPLPVISETLAGATSDFATAQANTTPMTIKEFILTRVRGFQIAQIEHEAMMASRTDEMSFVNGVKRTMDLAIQSAVNMLACGLFRNGTGSVGQISSITTGVIVLTDPNSVVQFKVGDVLQANATDGGGSPRSAAGYIIAIDRANGQFTVSASAGGSAGTPSSWAANDYLLVKGNNNSTISGLSAWLVNPANLTSTAFFGVDRTSDKWRLGGGYWNGATQSIEEAVIDASTLTAREGGEPDVGITNYGSYSALEKSLGAKATYTQLVTEVGEGEAKAQIGFRGIVINGANSQIRVFPDRNCQGYTMWLLTMKHWQLWSLGDAPHIFDYGDNTQMLRMGSNNAAEARIGYYAQLGCDFPGANCQVVLGQ